jgi:hypothetical protein
MGGILAIGEWNLDACRVPQWAGTIADRLVLSLDTILYRLVLSSDTILYRSVLSSVKSSFDLNCRSPGRL